MIKSSGNGAELTIQLCDKRAQECRALAVHTDDSRARIMLDHIAGTWERIAEAITNGE
jgi:hypothetical protein